MGKSPSTIKRLTRRGEQLGQQVIEAIAGTSLAKGVEKDALIKVKEQDEHDFHNLVDRAVAGEGVSAVEFLKGRKEPPVSLPENTEKAGAPATIDLTTGEAISDMLAVGGAAAEASFFQDDKGDGTFQSPENSGTEKSLQDTVSAPPWALEDEQYSALCRAWGEANGSARARFLEWANLSRH